MNPIEGGNREFHQPRTRCHESGWITGKALVLPEHTHPAKSSSAFGQHSVDAMAIGMYELIYTYEKDGGVFQAVHDSDDRYSMDHVQCFSAVNGMDKKRPMMCIGAATTSHFVGPGGVPSNVDGISFTSKGTLTVNAPVAEDITIRQRVVWDLPRDDGKFLDDDDDDRNDPKDPFARIRPVLRPEEPAIRGVSTIIKRTAQMLFELFDADHTKVNEVETFSVKVGNSFQTLSRRFITRSLPNLPTLRLKNRVIATTDLEKAVVFAISVGQHDSNKPGVKGNQVKLFHILKYLPDLAQVAIHDIKARYVGRALNNARAGDIHIDLHLD